MLQQQNISLVVSDVMMPEIDGIELSKRIKQTITCLISHHPTFTAKAMNLYIEEGFCRADDYIVKPFKVSTLKIVSKYSEPAREDEKIYGSNYH